MSVTAATVTAPAKPLFAVLTAFFSAVGLALVLVLVRVARRPRTAFVRATIVLTGCRWCRTCSASRPAVHSRPPSQCPAVRARRIERRPWGGLLRRLFASFVVVEEW